MSSLTAYTSTEAVIGALGLTDNEITPAMLTEQHLGDSLLLDLYEWLPTHATLWAAYLAEGATSEDQAKGYALRLFSTWFCAAQAAEMWLAMPQRISDGKTDMRRFATLDFEAIVTKARAKANLYKRRLQVLVDPTSTVTAPVFAGLSSPSYDPVTGSET